MKHLSSSGGTSRSRYRSDQFIASARDVRSWRVKFDRTQKTIAAERFWEDNRASLVGMHPQHAAFLVKAAVDPSSYRARGGRYDDSSPDLKPWGMPKLLRRKFFADLVQVFAVQCTSQLWKGGGHAVERSLFKNRALVHIHPRVEWCLFNTLAPHFSDAIADAEADIDPSKLEKRFNFKTLLFPDALLAQFLRPAVLEGGLAYLLQSECGLKHVDQQQLALAMVKVRHKLHDGLANSLEEYACLGSPISLLSSASASNQPSSWPAAIPTASQLLYSPDDQPFPVNLAGLGLTRAFIWSQAADTAVIAGRSNIPFDIRSGPLDGGFTFDEECGTSLHHLEREAARLGRNRYGMHDPNKERVVPKWGSLCQSVLARATLKPLFDRSTMVPVDCMHEWWLPQESQLADEDHVRRALVARFLRSAPVVALFPPHINDAHCAMFPLKTDVEDTPVPIKFSVLSLPRSPLSALASPSSKSASSAEPVGSSIGARDALQLFDAYGALHNASTERNRNNKNKKEELMRGFAALHSLQRAAFHFCFNEGDATFQRLVRPLVAHEAYARHRRVEEGFCLPDGTTLSKSLLKSELIGKLNGPRERRGGKLTSDNFEVLMHATRFRSQISREFRELPAEEQNSWDEADPVVQGVFPLVKAPSASLWDKHHRQHDNPADHERHEHHNILASEAVEEDDDELSFALDAFDDDNLIPTPSDKIA